jgi:hypothetical protein
MKTLLAFCACALLAAAWPGHAEAQPQDYTPVYDTYRLFTARDANSFNDFLVEAGRRGFFDKSFASCLTMLEQSWAAMSRDSACNQLPPGSVERAECFGRHRPSYLLRWSLSLRTAVSRGTAWPDTEIGREIAQGEAWCGVLGQGEFCRQLKVGTQQDATQMRPLLVCQQQ